MMKYLYSENYKTLVRENENTNRKNSLDHGLEGLILLKWPYYPKQSIDSVESLSKFQWYFS